MHKKHVYDSGDNLFIVEKITICDCENSIFKIARKTTFTLTGISY